MRMTDQIAENSLRLRALMGAPRTSEALGFVREMLAGRPPGPKSLSIQVLGTWGHAADKEMIKDFLTASLKKTKSRQITLIHVAIGALEHLILPADADWLLHLCFSQPQIERHGLFRLFKRLTPEVTRSYLIAQLKSEDWINRWSAARAIMAVRFPDQRKLLTPLLEDSSGLVRGTAENGISQAVD